MKESCHTYEGVMPCTYEGVMSHISHGYSAHIKESYTYDGVMYIEEVMSYIRRGSSDMPQDSLEDST